MTTATVQKLRTAVNNPGLYVSPVKFDTVSALIQGFDLACGGGTLKGFREWLIPKLDYGNNLAWPELLLRLTFPEIDSPRASLHRKEDELAALQSLCRVLDKFWEERDRPNGLQKILASYRKWLATQDWYEPPSSEDDGPSSEEL